MLKSVNTKTCGRLNPAGKRGILSDCGCDALLLLLLLSLGFLCWRMGRAESALAHSLHDEEDWDYEDQKWFINMWSSSFTYETEVVLCCLPLMHSSPRRVFIKTSECLQLHWSPVSNMRGISSSAAPRLRNNTTAACFSSNTSQWLNTHMLKLYNHQLYEDHNKQQKVFLAIITCCFTVCTPDFLYLSLSDVIFP